MTTEELIRQTQDAEDAAIQNAWPAYWSLLEKLESGKELDTAQRQELMECAKLLERRDKMSRDAERVRKMLQARQGLEKVTPKYLEAEKLWIERQTAELHAALLEFQKRQTPKAILVQERSQQYEQNRSNRGVYQGEIERFKLFIDAGPNSEAAQY